MFKCIKAIKGIKKDEIIPSEQIEQNETHRGNNRRNKWYPYDTGLQKN